ncbi:AGE family epimerase/isomerase [Algoriphagus halophytocola]|uniref:AGE family epimerase/isomerase n=1 Tax=Algoriphagus halophytocola TaxID=2991499 RepID=UPI0022DE7146|nr:AGE family epimerase/isomerase [Algoriphagus sp. TR-M9]WBL41863.1 AGE family epimerase/isomerase [Algoriphagus sp. TR-M9]
MSLRYSSALLLSVLIACSSPEREENPKEILALQMEEHLKTEVLDKWYPQAMDTLDGGFYSNFSYDFKLEEKQEKMIVTQSRHVWTNAKASLKYPKVEYYKTGAKHGFKFLKDKMWDYEYGGFHWLVDKQGKQIGNPMKTAYGNAFGIYALAAYYGASEDESALALAKEAFLWLDKHAHDSINGGYFQHLAPDGTPILRPEDTPSTSDLGYKDQNSSIHILEAFTELYQVWPDPKVKDRLEEMLLLIRDQIVTDKGYLTLFLYPDWQPVSFKDSTEEVITRHHLLDHVSFGHDVETGFLMIEASETLGWENDSTTHRIAKKMIDHALENGWDESVGGFYDEGYYFQDGYRVTHDTKNWWAQAEGMNALLLMAELYPNDPHNYYEKFEKLWDYTDTYLIDHENGDWYPGGLDKQPELKTVGKGNIWKGIYHHYRSLDHCIDRLREMSQKSE